MILEEVLKHSTYQISNVLYSVAKVDNTCNFENCFLVTRDELETTVIYRQDQHLNGIIEEKKDYVLIGINVAVPFYAPGFIATISSSFAKQAISVLVVSTYSRDYFLVSGRYSDLAVTILERLGIKRLTKEV